LGKEGDAFMHDKRFVRVYSQGSFNTMEVWVDKETGVNYIFRQSGYAGGMTVLLDKDGKPAVSTLSPEELDRL
jgi:hypothetical protein